MPEFEFRPHRLFCATWSIFHKDSGFEPLPQTKNGARALARALRDAGTLSDDPSILSDESGISTINLLEDFVSTPSESIIVYLASHGMFPTSKTGNFRLATGDTRLTSDLVRSLPMHEIIDRLIECPSEQKILVIDSCYSGWSVADMMAPKQAPPNIMGANLCVLASSSPYEASLAPKGEELTRFTGHLIEALHQATGVAQLTIRQMYDFVRTRSSPATGPVPWFVGEGETADAVVLPADSEPPHLDELVSARDRFDYRAEILYVEDMKDERRTFVDEVRSHKHTVTVAETPEEALAALDGSYFDIIVLDLFLVGDVPATELLLHIGANVTESLVILASRASMASEAWKILDAVFAHPNPVDAFVFKSDHIDRTIEFADSIRDERRETLGRVEELEQMVPLVAGRIIKRSREDLSSLSDTLQLQTRICVQQLVKRWFDSKKPATDYIERMTMAPVGSGRSSCSVFSLLPTILGLEPAAVSPLLLKLGPRSEIEEEVERFNKYVQIGVPLSVRTDMVGSASVGAIGGVVYSLLGGDHQDIRELEGLSASEIEDCLRKLLDPLGKRWYAAQALGEGIRPLAFFEQKKFDRPRFGRVASALQQGLKNAGLGVEEEIDPFFFERPGVNSRQPSTLVHGDLHLGNILKYDEDRYALIDYRNVGIGPRLADFVSLETACWLLALPPSRPRRELVLEVLTAASGGLDDPRTEADISEWLRISWRLALTCRTLAQGNFEDISPQEYGSLLWFTVVRRSEMQARATSKQEKLAMHAVPHALALAAQRMVRGN